jgi:FdhE protein
MNRAYAEIARYSEILPQYRESLILFRKILEFKSRIMDEISAGTDGRITGLKANSLEIREKLQSGSPLFENDCIPISPSLFRKCLEEFLNLLPEESTRAAADRLLASGFMAPGGVETILNELSTDMDSCIGRLARDTCTKTDIIHFLLRTVLSPFFENRARFYRDLIDPDTWRQGKCPICGSEPAIARLAKDDGRRFLTCSLCNTEWIFDRLRCPFCEQDGTPKVRHFTVGEDEVHRVECCDTCRCYLKVVDERAAGHSTVPLVENVITAHLDMLAVEQGYR